MDTEQISKLYKCQNAQKNLSMAQDEVSRILIKLDHGSHSDYGKELTTLSSDLKKGIDSLFMNCRKEINNLIKKI
jgi:hypothetical protein